MLCMGDIVEQVIGQIHDTDEYGMSNEVSICANREWWRSETPNLSDLIPAHSAKHDRFPRYTLSIVRIFYPLPTAS
jgi:hypothetical protein